MKSWVRPFGGAGSANGLVPLQGHTLIDREVMRASGTGMSLEASCEAILNELPTGLGLDGQGVFHRLQAEQADAHFLQGASALIEDP